MADNLPLNLPAMIAYKLFIFAMSGLCSILTSPGGGLPSREDLQLIQALLSWPPQYSFPGIHHDIVMKYTYMIVRMRVFYCAWV